MLETIQNFESVMGPAARDHPLVVIGPGGAAVVAGLLIWLGGLGFRKVLLGIAGAAGGAVVGFYAIQRGTVTAAISAVVGGAIAMLFERVVVALLLAVLVGTAGFVLLVGPRISTENEQTQAESQESAGYTAQSVDQVDAYLRDLKATVRRARSEVPVYKWLIVVLLAVIILVGGFVFRRLAAALCFSVLGSLLIAAGMIALLLYKGAAPLSQAGNRPMLYTGIFAGMVAFGTIEQLLFCRGGLIRHAKKAQAEDHDAGGQKHRGD
ncbi:MAG: hypothetical protein P8Z79_17840 [Sedimentisphaerales bacterium]|jgi:hypothetical protein